MNALAKCHRRSFATAVICLLIHATAWSQPSADFISSAQSGCSPLIVHFTDQSTGSPGQWKWDLGNGVTAHVKDPSATYFDPGTYTIKLVVSNAAGKDSVVKNHYITVYANPVVDFEASDTTGCFPKAVQFTDASTAGSGNITNWQWDFGDGTISDLTNPLHVYASAGNYNVTLKVTNSFGCVKTVTKNQYITITNGVKAGFSLSTQAFCSAPANVSFNNTSTGPAPLSYTWHFGDGTTSTEKNPNHSYAANGAYSVTLIVKSPQGCVDTIKKTNVLSVGAGQPGFTMADTACVKEPVNFTNTSTATPTSVTWYFGDGTTSTAASPVKKYNSAGVYTVKLVNNYGGCKDSVSKQITVREKTKAAFTALTKVFCQTPATVQFQSQSPGATSYYWIFGDGSISTEANPIHTYQFAGNFNVTLVVSTGSGCSDTLKQNNFITVKKPKITFLGLLATGCAPVSIHPSATIVSHEPVLSYLWKFGDGTTSTQASPAHTYLNPGNYDVTLVITTAGGCTDSLKMVNAVRAGTKPNADFSALPPEVCNLNPVYFTDNSTGNVDQWYWLFGDSLSSMEQNPSHVFENIGLFDVMLVVWNNTCADTIIKKNVVNVLPPLALFNVKRDCIDKYTVSLEDKSVGATSVIWDFGDGTTSTERDVTHTYAAPGVYHVTFKVFNANCWNINEKDIKIIDEKTNLVADQSSVCKSGTVNFSSSGIHAANIKTWRWEFGDGGVSNEASSSSHVYTNAGNYEVVLSVKDLNGCVQKDTMMVSVYGPTAAFTTTNRISCLENNMVSFTSASTGDGTYPIVEYKWNFGDGSTESSSQEQSQHQYAAAGSYAVSLVVVSSNGCTDTLKKNAEVIIADPKAVFSVSDTMSCAGEEIQFFNSSTGKNPSYQWNFGDGDASTVKEPSHVYTNLGDYPVTLLVKDKYGCMDSLTKPSFIKISRPEAKFTVSDSVGTCPPLMVNFTNQSSNYTSLEWNFGDGNTSHLPDPSHFYNTPGVFYATLVVKGAGQCSDTAVQKIEVRGPNGNFSYTPISGCSPLAVSFTATTENTTKLLWDFGDGHTNIGSSNTTTHTYTSPGEYLPRIILSDAAGCNYPVMGVDTIRVYDVKASFTANLTNLCARGLVKFTSTSASNDVISGYHWNFGDGSSSTEQNPEHFYDTSGNYTVQLTVTTQGGCTSSYVLTNGISILPAPSIKIDSKLAACAPAVMDFSGVSMGDNKPVSWLWNFDNDQTANVQNPFFQNYSSAGDYTVTAIATAANGCTDTAVQNITIHSLPATNAGQDQFICRGENIQLNATGAASYVWANAPGLNCTDCASPLAAPTESVLYTVTGVNEFGCKKTDSVVINVRQPFKLEVEPGDTVCVGSTVQLQAGGADLYSWTPNAGVKNPGQAHTTATPSVSTTYTVIGKDLHNCFADTATVFVKVWPIPTVNAGADQTLAVGNTLQLKTTTSADVSSWQWSNAGSLSCSTCPVTLANPRQTTTYRVQVKNGGGCSAYDDVTVNVICNNGNLFVPNTFSPNGDGANDRFFPGGTGINRIKTLRVFNRWGEVVFEKRDFAANDASSGWDGSFKGQKLSPDVYIWNCEVICQNNEVLVFKGDVTLLR